MKKILAVSALMTLAVLFTWCGKQEVPFEPDPEFQPTPEMEEMARMAQ